MQFNLNTCMCSDFITWCKGQATCFGWLPMAYIHKCHQNTSSGSRVVRCGRTGKERSVLCETCLKLKCVSARPSAYFNSRSSGRVLMTFYNAQHAWLDECAVRTIRKKAKIKFWHWKLLQQEWLRLWREPGIWIQDGRFLLVLGFGCCENFFMSNLIYKYIL